jgi:flagellar motor component MotA
MNSFAPLIDPNAFIFMTGCMVISQKFGAPTFFLIAELIVPMGIVATLMSVVSMLGAGRNPNAVYSNIPLALLRAAYAILIKGVLSIATDLPRPSESQFELGGLGCLLLIALI